MSAQRVVAENTGRRNGPFISLKNGSFKEPLLSVHFAWTLGHVVPVGRVSSAGARGSNIL